MTVEQIFSKIWDTHAPMKKRRRRHKRAPWITKEINHFRRCHNQSYKSYLNNKTEENWIYYKQSCNIYNSAIRQAKRNLLISGLKKLSATLWKHLKTCCGSSKLRSATFPWPVNTKILAKTSANEINNHL